MKTPMRGLLLLAYAAVAYVAAAPGLGDVLVAAVCRDLSVLDVDSGRLPEGVSASDLWRVTRSYGCWCRGGGGFG
ncbi:hypothetical protein CSUB01_12476 [Colletotrichum sublineola]|uniref:Uncharacterized protein n=1 Tax=Colletotrichum sublineola TaxID=1173701 RepID=A0A066XDW1_COLSU|nr:hypothetical protein CSUB01_12476 [Colletotrichum sublineola]